MANDHDHTHLHDAILKEFKDIRENHLSHIYVSMGVLEADGRWIKKLMAGVFAGVVVIAGSLLALVAKAL